MRWISRHLPFVGILLLATYLLTINVTTPWQSIHEDNGTLNESIAINHIRYGLGVTRGQDLLDLEAKQSFGPQHVSEAQHFAYFLHGATHPRVYGDHPPLLGLTIAGAFLLFGDHFWVERLVPIVYALLGLLLCYQLALLLWDVVVARVAALLYATFPMFAYFGRDVSHEAPVLCWALLLLVSYLRWRQSPALIWAVLMVLAIIIGGGYGWPMFYFAPLLAVIDTIAERRAQPALLLLTLVPAALTLIVVFGQLTWALNGDLTRLGEMFLHRTSGGGELDATTTIGWFTQVAAWNIEGFDAWSRYTLPLLVGFVVRCASIEGWSLRIRTVVLLAAWGLSHILIFRNGAFVHAYWQFYLLPVYALVVAWMATTLVRYWIAPSKLRGVALATVCFVAVIAGLPTILSLYSTGYQTTLPIVPLFDLWR